MEFIENDYCELKSIITKEIKKEIVAFANTRGGKICIGVSDDGKVIGVENADKEVQALTGMINEGIKPSLIEYTQIKIEKCEGKDIIVIDTQESQKKPHYLADKGIKPSGVYLRHGTSSIQATDEIIKKMLYEHSNLRFEEMISKNQTLTFNYLEKKFKDNNLAFDQSKYKILNLVNEGNIFTNLGALLSDQCQYTIKCAIFNGKNKLEFKDRKEFTGSLIKQVDDVFEYFDLFNKVKGEINGLKRIDIPDYPVYSLREALLNAVIHRSFYFDSSILITIFDDRIEMVSMGGLINGISIKEIFKGISATRNPNLANIFYRLGYVESFGTGIGRIMDSYEKYDKKPVFDATDNTFSIILPNANYKDEILQVTNDSYTQENYIINYLKENGKINRADVEKLLNVSKTRAHIILGEMLENNLIVKNGTGRTTIYTLK